MRRIGRQGQREITKEKDKEKQLTRVEGIDREDMPKVHTPKSVAGVGIICLGQESRKKKPKGARKASSRNI